jgi:phospholipid/cholesterol/gamma-HCH transport system substrate-binding protein
VTISKEVKVGALAIVSGVMLYTGFNFLKGTDFFSTIKRYNVVYENVGGIKVSTPVMIKGLNVGRVERMISLPDQCYKTLVVVQIDKHYKITENCVADIVELGLLDGKAIELLMKDGKRVLTDGDTLLGNVEPGLISSAKEKFTPLISNVDTSLAKVKTILNRVDEKKLDHIFTSLDLASKELYLTVKDSRVQINAMSSNINILTTSLSKTEKSLAQLLTKLNTLGDSLNKAQIAQTVNNANKAVIEMKEVLARMNSGQGTLGKLSKNDSLYNNLNKTAADLDKLLVDLKEHPNRYVHLSVFGRKEKKEKN